MAISTVTKVWAPQVWAAKVQAAAQIYMREAAELVRNTAANSMKQAPAPGVPSAPGTPPNRQTGDLASSGDVEVRVSATTVDGYVKFGDSTTDYAIAQEMGTFQIPPRPYLRPALQSRISDIIRILSKPVP